MFLVIVIALRSNIVILIVPNSEEQQRWLQKWETTHAQLPPVTQLIKDVDLIVDLLSAPTAS